MEKTDEFKELFRAHYPGVFRRLTYILADPAAAEDLAQEVFMKLLHSPPKDRSNAYGWLITVANNMAYNYLRSEKNRREREVRREAQSDSRGFSKDDAALMVVINEVRDTLEKLDARDRVCLLLQATGGSYDEIAEAIGVKKSSVGSILVRARAKFQTAYGPETGGVSDVLRTRRTPGLSRFRTP